MNRYLVNFNAPLAYFGGYFRTKFKSPAGEGNGFQESGVEKLVTGRLVRQVLAVQQIGDESNQSAANVKPQVGMFVCRIQEPGAVDHFFVVLDGILQ